MSGRWHRRDYPSHWQHLRAQALARDGHACACRGECGSPHAGARCGVPNDVRIVRDPAAPQRWWDSAQAPVRPMLLPTPLRSVRVVLTVGHLCRTSWCDDLAHLRTWCQRCHLVYDQAQHLANAARTRRQRQVAVGQLALWPHELPRPRNFCCGWAGHSDPKEEEEMDENATEGDALPDEPEAGRRCQAWPASGSPTHAEGA